MSAARRRVLVAGIGNVFLGDDGFGVEVVRRIDTATLPPPVDVADYGIRGIHLAYDLLDGRHDTLIMVDAVPLDAPPGTLAVLDAGPAAAGSARATARTASSGAAGTATASAGRSPATARRDTAGAAPADETGTNADDAACGPPSLNGHGLHPQAVLDLLHGLGGRIDRVLVVGCRPAELGERMGLSRPVEAAVDDAVRLVTELAREEAAGGNAAGVPDTEPETEGDATGA